MARRRRSPRLHPQIHASGDGAGLARRRSPRLHPQIHASEDGAGMACRRSPRLHPQIQASKQGAGTTPRRRSRRGTSSPAPASLPDNEDMLWEILLRLPPRPSSLPRASAVCRRWRGLVTDPRFLRRFRAHHRKPPLLGVFQSFDELVLTGQRRWHPPTINWRIHQLRSILEPPDRIPLHLHGYRTSIRSETQLVGCRHGRVLLMGGTRNKGHMHGSCHSSPFKVVVMSPCGEDDLPVARVYSSETGVWGNTISTTARCGFGAANPGILVGNVLYWSSKSVGAGVTLLNLDGLTDDIIELDLDKQSLAVINGPPDLDGSLVHQIIKAEDGAVGLVVFADCRFKFWERKVNRHGDATWFLHKCVGMHTILGLPTRIERPVRGMEILGYDEDNNVIFLYVYKSVYMVQLMPMQSRKLYESRYPNSCHPFTGFYEPAGGCDGAGMLPLV